MIDKVSAHYTGEGHLSDAIADRLRAAGKDLGKLKTTDLANVDEFHIRGRRATTELAERMRLDNESRVLDIGSGLGGPARTLAEEYGCHVTGLDLTQEFCEAAKVLSEWVKLDKLLEFKQGDATFLPFEDNQFDAAMTIHVAMNILAKNKMYEEARRVVKPGGIFAVYDVLKGEGGDVLYPVPWAREPSISHLTTPREMELLLADAGFNVLDINDSTDESQRWFEEMAARLAKSGPAPVTWQAFIGDDFPVMARNQVRNVTERRIRTVSFICAA